MTHHSTARQSARLPVPQSEHLVAYLSTSCQALVGPSQRRGRPPTLSGLHVCLGIMRCGLRGFGAQLGLWRLVCLEALGPFLPVLLSDQAIYNRLERAAGLMATFFEQVSGWMGQQLAGWEERQLAPFAKRVLSLDESTLDVVGRWLADLRPLLSGDPRLLAGRISALFDVRLQQWVRVDLLEEASANCKQHAHQMLTNLEAGVLLLFDRGYLSFPGSTSSASGACGGSVAMPIMPVCRCGTSSIRAMASLMPLCGWASTAPIAPSTRYAWCSSISTASCTAT